MAGNTENKNEIYSENDALDINELASLNEDFSPEFIEQLQNQVSKSAGNFSDKQDDSTLFEEITNSAPQKKEVQVNTDINETYDDNFIKKYKAKLNKQQNQALEKEALEKESTTKEHLDNKAQKSDVSATNVQTSTLESSSNVQSSHSESSQPLPNVDLASTQQSQIADSNKIEGLTSGNIVERPVQQEQIKYNESLDYIDDNVKYSKYVIYINPENTEFIESLTVKERKNLINKLLREQDDIAITKRRLSIIQTVIKHAIIAVITIALFIPITYHIVNASLEASINNYRRSQKYFNTLYKEKGKIKKIQRSHH